MKRKRQKAKQPYVKPILAGFCALYLTSMLLFTYMMHLQYTNTFLLNAQSQAQQISDHIQDVSASYKWDGRKLSENQKGFLRYALSFYPDMSDKYQPFSVALYDHNGNLAAQTCNLSTIQTAIPITASNPSETPYLFYDLADYLSEDELIQAAQYQKKNYEAVYTEKSFSYLTKGGFPYVAEYQVHPDTKKLQKITISEATWETRDISGIPHLKDKTPIWQWSSMSLDTTSLLTISEDTEIGYFPYLAYGFSYWQNWTKNTHLQQYPKIIDSYYETPGNLHIYTQDNLKSAAVVPVTFAGDEDMAYTYLLILHHDPHPWLAAINYLKFVYLWGFLLTLVCTKKVLHITDKTYKQQAALEETRRDFTNAVAHELKTPLSIILGFAENVKENTMKEKRDYYLEQIIGQTEEMDTLVQEMIYMSKLDSDQLVLKKEALNLMDILQRQFYKLDSICQEKNITISYHHTDAFYLEGDLLYLEKMLWNLASNAVFHNHTGGTISVTSEKNRLILFNTGAAIPEEDLPHIFDMFYTGNKSRSSKEKHFGLGLYLAKRICTLHHLQISISNTEHGIQTILTR